MANKAFYFNHPDGLIFSLTGLRKKSCSVVFRIMLDKLPQPDLLTADAVTTFGMRLEAVDSRKPKLRLHSTIFLSE
jgi:hypothetical protein